MGKKSDATWSRSHAPAHGRRVPHTTLRVTVGGRDAVAYRVVICHCVFADPFDAERRRRS